MTSHGDDCYFYYYSTCTKGDSCPFRHCEAARGNETVCNLWEEGRCFRSLCKFRHMEITKNRKEIPCYWEKQPAGCQKPHCAFFHEKPRQVDGMLVPPDKSQSVTEEHVELTPPLVPSPTHPPVVINPADDDEEDEDDQFSEEEENGKVGFSPLKIPKSEHSLNFGVSTLEEIRLRKALKASMMRAGFPVQSTGSPANGEKENIKTIFEGAVSESRGPFVFEQTERERTHLTNRPGRRFPSAGPKSGDGFPLKRSLAERLGRVVHEEQPAPQRGLKSVKERLGLVSEPKDVSPPETVSGRPSEGIRIKTLKEIRQEKASKSQDSVRAISSKSTRVIKRGISVKESPIRNAKAVSEAPHAKKLKQERKLSPKRAESAVKSAAGRTRGSPDPAPPPSETVKVEKVRVKTLEEIRQEKVAKKQTQQPEAKQTSEADSSRASRPSLRRPPTQSDLKPPKSAAEVTEKAVQPAVETKSDFKVKTFEEIMREKRLRKQEVEEQKKVPAEAEACQNQDSPEPLKKCPIKRSPLPPPSPSKSTKAPKRSKLTSLISDSPSAKNKLGCADSGVPGGVSAPQKPDFPQRTCSPRTSPEPSAGPGEAAPVAPAGAASAVKFQTKAPERPAHSKGRPKLKVKPSVVKPVKLGQKRAAESSAVAAVKPLKSSRPEAALREATGRQESSHTEPQNPPSPLEEECRAASSQQTRRRVSVEAAAGAQSPAQRSSQGPAQSGSVEPSSACVDDFEDLINQFAGDDLEAGDDPAILEDDLLQELSEMIDS